MRAKPESPYIASPNRLADVIAAIQAMAVYDFHMQSFEKWAVRITGDDSKSEYWKKVFVEHPEFFRLDTTRKLASLVWRRQYPKRYHVDRQEMLTEQEYKLLDEDETTRLSRPPLGPGDIKTLIDAATNLHTRAVELRRESRWWVPLAGALGALAGAIIGSVLKG
ncbi:hypothetical protein [Pseudoduganella rhizocola]|uniref:hypothetical protein n=1 Tax=Pseudoduganella rhizocola TaxID=3382643 RepID=UPI0038B4FD71